MSEKSRLDIPNWQNYVCTGCGRCCRRGFEIWLPTSEKDRLSAIDWAKQDPALAGELFKPTPRGWRIDLDTQGACRFLDEENRCRMHAAIGFAKKPLTCKQYPFVFGHAPGVEYVGTLYSCPAICDNEGKALSRQKSLARDLLAERQRFFDAPADTPAVAFDSMREIPDAGLRSLELACVTLIDPLQQEAEGRASLTQRFLRVAALVDAVDDMNSLELESAIACAAIEKLAREAASIVFRQEEIGSFSKRQFALFRQACGLMARGGETELLQSRMTRRIGARLRRFQIATRYLFGLGFGPAQQVRTDIDARGEDLLRRFVTTRIFTRTYIGKNFAGLDVLDGLRLTLLTVPLALWHARIHAKRQKREALTYEDIREGVITVDLTLGHRPDLGGVTQRLMRSLCTPSSVRRAIADGFRFVEEEHSS